MEELHAAADLRPAWGVAAVHLRPVWAVAAVRMAAAWAAVVWVAEAAHPTAVVEAVAATTAVEAIAKRRAAPQFSTSTRKLHLQHRTCLEMELFQCVGECPQAKQRRERMPRTCQERPRFR